MDSKIKILIGILAIGIVLIGGWWIWNNRPSESVPGEEIYDGKGETITFRIDNTVKICTNGLPFSIIKSSGESVELKHSCMGFVGSGFDQYCENGKIVSKPLHQLCDFSEKWCRGCSDVLTCRDEPIHETFVWDQKEYVEITEECEGKTIHREILKQVPEGKYKIVVYDINGNEKVINEFTIKEMEITCDEKCKSLGYASGVCRSFPLIPEEYEKRCNFKEGETDAGHTADCNPFEFNEKGEPIGGGGKTCCCKVKENGVIITTDKTEYMQGEPIKMTAKNNILHTVYHCITWEWIIEKKENGSWKELDVKAMVYTPLIKEFLSGETLSTITSDENDWRYEAKNLVFGTYRVGFKFFSTLDDSIEDIRENCWEKEPSVVYSNEFTIKEKSGETYCEKDDDCGWVGCCPYDHKCMRKDVLSCPKELICLAYITAQPQVPCSCVENRCKVKPETITCNSTIECDEKFKFMGNPCESTNQRLSCIDNRCMCK